MSKQIRHQFYMSNKYLLVMSSILFFACTSGENGKMKVENKSTNSDIVIISKKQFESANMELGSISEVNFPTLIRSNGTIDVPPEGKATVSTFYSGYVKTISLLPGDKVVKGQMVLTLENPEYIEMQQEFLEAKSQLSYLKADYERQKTLNSEQISSQKNFMKSETEYRITLTKIESLKKKLRMININPSKLSESNLTSVITLYAPITGYITEVDASKGMLLSPSKEAIEIVNTEHVHLELNVFEKDIQKVKEGQKIHFRLPSNDSEVYEADVHLVGKKVSTDSRIVGIHGHLHEDAPDTFLPGMYIEAQIEVDNKKAHVVPEQAIVNIGNTYYLLVLISDKGEQYEFKRTEVLTGGLQKGNVEILNSSILTFQDKILTKGAFNMIK